MMKFLPPALLAFALAIFSFSTESKELAIDLSESVVPITAGFDGSDLLLFGAGDVHSDIVVIVRGPMHDELVRRKERAFGVWVNGAEMAFQDVPSFYYIASNRPFEEFIPHDVARQRQIGYEDMIVTPKKGFSTEEYSDADMAAFRKALIRVKQDQGLYGKQTGNVHYIGDKLFRTQLRFPNNIPVGSYSVDVFMFRDGRIVDEKTAILGVQKFGIEAEVYDFAHRHAFLYGVLAILLATVAGWAASVIFRKG